MRFPHDAARRLATLGYHTESEQSVFREIYDREGPEFLWRFLEKMEESADAYREWFPRLQSFAVECRGIRPAPREASLSRSELAQSGILRQKMRDFAASENSASVFGGKPFHASILSTSWVGLAAAEETFSETSAVILEQSERDHWFSKVYAPDAEEFWWYAFAWWTVADASDNESRVQCDPKPVPVGGAQWLITSGVRWGGLAGGADHEQWLWDGERAESLGIICIDTY